MASYMIIPREDPATFADLSPTEMQELVGRYVAWAQGLAEAGRLVMGHKLKDGEGRVVRGDDSGGMGVTDGPFVETKEVVGGFWVVEADSMDHALEAITTCPHLEYGSLEVREIEAT